MSSQRTSQRAAILLCLSLISTGCFNWSIHEADGSDLTNDGEGDADVDAWENVDADVGHLEDGDTFLEPDVEGCNLGCDAPNATSGCVNDVCVIVDCATGYTDVNELFEDGCEALCDESTEDLPDGDFRDINCDGIDGDISRALFVSTEGDDGNPGTMDRPLRSINVAIQRAQSTVEEDHIYVSTGEHHEAVELASGISLWGGFSADDGWTRGSHGVTEIIVDSSTGDPVIGFSGQGILAQTIVADLYVTTGDSLAPGASNYGVHCFQCEGLQLERITVTAGGGAPGESGGAGNDGESGGTGSWGGAGSCDTTSWGSGGDGGYSSCGHHGGDGGDGGIENSSGQSGYTGYSGTSGGSGGAWGDPGSDGHDGNDGSGGTDGANGAGALAGGAIIEGLWFGYAGFDGSVGENGNGGGGGGGGGGQSCVFCDNGSGDGGGGGGGGGGGAGSGRGGQPGGGSFGVMLIESTGAALRDCFIESSAGGPGGAGGDGGSGGVGGSGGDGSGYCSSEVGTGGDGGDGGHGGRGGAGGGGAGGPSFAVYLHDTTDVELTTSELVCGLSGQGGPSSGEPGAQGESGACFGPLDE